MSVCKVHNVRFYKPKLKPIYCMSFNPESKKLAVSRSNGFIEIWNLQSCHFIEKTITSTIEINSIEGLAWSEDRLFSVGLHGFLIEYDLKRLAIKYKTSVTGQSAFCLDINKNKQIAVGTEQGYMNIFDINDDEIVYNKFLDKQEGRILCLKYDHTGNFIVSGSMDAIRIWDVASGNALHRMTTGRSEANKSTIVWCLAILQDFTVVSGDSRGKLTFWDGKIGAQIESYQSHNADILSLSVSSDEKTLYCAGVDPNIVSYVKINVKDNHKWVKSIQRKVHDHDVRALILNDHKLYSGGGDGYLACSFHPPKTLMKYAPILQKPCAVVAAEARFLLLRQPKCIEVWSLGETKEDAGGDCGSFLPLKNDSKKLLQLQRLVKDRVEGHHREGIIMGTISGDGQWIVFSTQTTLRLFNFKYESDFEPQLIPKDSLPEECGPSIKAVFTPNNNKLILVTSSGNIQSINLTPTLLLTQTIDTESHFKDTISFLKCSSCSQYFMAADCQSNIAVWKCIEDSWKFYCKLPRYEMPITALSLQPKSMNAVIAYADHKVVEFNLFERKLTRFSKELDAKKHKLFSKGFPIRTVAFDPRNDKVIILHDDANIVIINKEKKLPDGTAKIPKIETKDPGDRGMHAIHAIKKYKHLVHLDWLSNDEMVAVEVSPLTLLEQLPSGLATNTFGTK